jgi:hypothetical protein
MKYIKAFQEHVLDTAPQEYVVVQTVLVCTLSNEIHSILSNEVELLVPKVYVSTISLKHSYDRRPDFTAACLSDLYDVLRNPIRVAKNLEGKKGDYIFYGPSHCRPGKMIGCPVEVVEIETNKVFECVSFFPTKNMKYFEKFPTLWDREDGEQPPS